MMALFKLQSSYRPSGDQPQAIEALLQGFAAKKRYQTLLGVTGSGKTFTLANVIAKLERPVLILSHNKTLAAQLYSEFKGFFPENAVEYFISYYDYYLPESYIPQTDTYIAKDASINDSIEKLRLSATASLVERRDVIVVASVSCIYGLGSPDDYADMCVTVRVGDQLERNAMLHRLIDIQYERNDTAPEAGQFRVRGDAVEIHEPQRDDFIRINFWGNEVESISRHDAVSGQLKTRPNKITFFPCKHFVLPAHRIEEASDAIRREMKERVRFFENNGLLVEAQRIYQRVNYDLEMMQEIGYCSGIENYSMHLAKRRPGSRPYCLFDFFPPDLVTVIDESHVTLPQVQGMYKADRSRKQTLIDHGFRLPSALENRPLKFDEFEKLTNDIVFVSATPGPYELEHSGGVIEQIIRPTGLLDPLIEVRPLEGQVDDVMAEIRAAAAKHERVLVTTLTKKSSERLADYLSELGLKTSYLHSELDALERVRVLAKLREGDFDCLIGINLLREGIDLPEVALVAILDADKEGFLRSERSLIQVAGRAARNVNGRVILYGDHITPSMQALIDGSQARRARQEEYNRQHRITPKTIVKDKLASIADVVANGQESKKKFGNADAARAILDGVVPAAADGGSLTGEELQELILELEGEMLSAAEALEFERAATLRDQIRKLSKNNFIESGNKK
ncbi:excinuclease ABC subunit UvrB [Victivallis sp. Marseille-Q1083]|uniref:excinuclease ABC subunit UvrB n=1 Tax=Victivallis sp. Marseille-Q1083 TaxID=2717288 RepID=UPI00158A772F